MKKKEEEEIGRWMDEWDKGGIMGGGSSFNTVI
jgi:hypothetical protein